MPELIRLPQVRADVIAIATWIGERDELAAERFLTAVEADFDRLRDSPGVGAPMEPLQPWMADLRVWPVTGFENYLIIYRERPGLVEIAYIVHGARDLSALRRRLR